MDQIDAIKFNESMFITNSPLKKRSKQQQSYSELQQMNLKTANEVIQGKINVVLEEPGKRLSRKGPYPDVDFSKLTAKQRTDVNTWIEEIKQLQKEQHHLKKQMANNGEYEMQRKNRENEDFYDECLKSCSKEIIKIHETN